MPDFVLKDWFFDGEKVKKAVDKATRKVLSKFGAFVRTTAVHSIKDSTKPSEPGQPPHSHLGARRKATNKRRKQQGLAPIKGGWKGIKQILFAYNPATESVVIGPVVKDGLSQSIVLPILEYGGTETITSHGKRITVSYQARPFMGPAFEKEKPKLPALWRDSVK